MLRLSAAVHRRSRCRDVRGVTLVEVLLSILLTAVLIGPLSMLFIATIRGSAQTDDMLTRSGDAQRIGESWTKDVQNLAVGGLNSDPCPAPDGFNAEETHLVSMRGTTDSSALRGAVTASWVAIGAGERMELVRRECEPGAGLVSEQLLAMRVGEPGQAVAEAIHGPAGPGSGDFCPYVDESAPGEPESWMSRSCTIIISGAFDYELEVSRRVPEPATATQIPFPPEAPTISDAVGRNEYITFSWGLLNPPVGQPPIEAYRLFVYTDPAAAPITSSIVDGQSNTTSISDLVNGTPYFARLQARNSMGWGALSEVYGPVEPQPTAPDAPTVPAVSPGDQSVLVNWTPNPNDGGDAVSSWNLYAIDGNGNEIGPAQITPGSATSGSIQGLTNGTSYRVVVAGVNALGEGLRSDLSETVVPFGAPPPAGGVIAQANDATAQMRWIPPEDDNGRPIIGYTVRAYQGIDQATPLGPGTYFSNADAACDAVCQVDLPLPNAHYYRFTVATRSDVGDGTTIDGAESALSEPYPAPAIQPNLPPYVRPSTAPSATAAPVLANAGGSALQVSFVMPDDGGEPVERVFVDFQVRSTASGSQWSSGWTSANSNGFEVSGPPGATRTVTFNGSTGNQYRVRVAAANRGEWFSPSAGWRLSPVSPTSNTVTLVAAPSVPTSVSVSRTPGNTYPFSARVAYGRPNNDGGACIDRYEVQFSNNASTVVSTVQRTGSPSGAPPSCSGEPVLSADVGNIVAGESTRYFRVRARNTGEQWGSWSSWSSTTALRQACTVPAVADTYVSRQSSGSSFGGETSLQVQREHSTGGFFSPTVNHERWTLLRFDPSANGTNCDQFGAPLPSSAVVYGGPTSPDSAGRVTIEMFQNQFADCGIFFGSSNQRVGVWQATSGWTESTTWNSRPGRSNYTDEIRGGSNNSWRWWWVNTSYANDHRTGGGFGWVFSHNDGNCNDPWSFRSREHSAAHAPRLNMMFY